MTTAGDLPLSAPGGGGDHLRELDGKVALVSGAGGGIGAATAQLLVARGARVIAADVNREAAEDVVRQIRDRFKYRSAIAVEMDVTNEAQVQAAVATANAEFGGVDVLHNNAAFTTARGDSRLTELSSALWDETMAVNVRGYFLCVKHVIASMRSRGGGSIIHTSSIAGLLGERIRPAYATSKAAIIGFSRHVATQLGASGIRSNVVAPGLITTPAALTALTDDARRMYEEHHLLGRLGTAADVAEVVAFLASDRAAFLTGTVIPVDGGFSIHSPTMADEWRRRRASASNSDPGPGDPP